MGSGVVQNYVESQTSYCWPCAFGLVLFPCRALAPWICKMGRRVVPTLKGYLEGEVEECTWHSVYIKQM